METLLERLTDLNATGRKSLYSNSLKKKEDKELEIPKGKGEALSDHPNVVANLTKVKVDDPILRKLHNVLFASRGKKHFIKKNIRKFSGFATDDAEKTKQDLETKLNKLDKTELRDISDILDVKDATGSKPEVISAMIDFFLKPKPGKTQEGGTLKRRRSTKGSKKRKGSKKKSTKGARKGKMSGYLLFSSETRSKIKSKDPDISFSGMAKELAKRWGKLDDDEKQEWNDKAAKANKEKAAAGSDDDEDGGKEKS